LLFWPFKLYTFQFGIIPDKIETFTPSNDNCTSAYGFECRQYWRTALNLKRGTCTLDGTYAFNFTVGCGECCATNCTLDSTDSRKFDVSFRLTSENFCAEIVVDVAIVGNIRSYENNTFCAGCLRSAFSIGKRAYYWIKVNSELNPKNSSGQADPDIYDDTNALTIVKFSKVELVYVDIKFSNNSLLRIWDNKKAVIWALTSDKVDYKTLCQLETVNTQTQNSVAFSFVWSREVAPVLRNQKLTHQIVASVQVTYAQTGNKRFTLQTTGDDKTSFTQTSDVNDPDNTDTTNPTASGTGTGASNTGTGAATTATGTSNTGTGSNPQTTTKDSSFALIASLMTLLVALLI